MKVSQSAHREDQTAVRRACERRDRLLDPCGVAHADRNCLHAERGRRGLDDGELTYSGGYGGISKDRYPRHARRDLFEQLQPFRTQAVLEAGEPGGIAAWPRQAV